MSINLIELEKYCDQFLNSKSFKDYCPNGLQVAGIENVKKIVTGVTACQALLDQAVAEKADLVLVHHGYFWRGEDQRIISMKKKRLKTLLVNDMSLLAYHLPLDAHSELGNNAQLAKKMGWVVKSGMGAPIGESIVMLGEVAKPCTGEQLAENIKTVLKRAPLHIKGHTRDIKTIAWCTGSAQSYLEEVASYGVDAFISGEISEQTVHLARELGIDYLSAGHHATESYGVQALGEHLAKTFDLEHLFIDVPNPV